MFQNHWTNWEFFTPSFSINRGLLHWEGRPCFELWVLWFGTFTNTSWILKHCTWMLLFLNYVCRRIHYLCVWLPIESAVLRWISIASLWTAAAEKACMLQKYLEPLNNFFIYTQIRTPKIKILLYPKHETNYTCY